MEETVNKDNAGHYDSDASYDHVLKYTGVFGGVQGLTMLMSIVRNKFASELLGRSGIALIGIYNSIATFMSSTSNLGIPFSAVRNISELFEKGSEKEIKQYVCVVRTWSLWTGLLGFLLCLCLSPLISFLSFDGDMSYTLQICMIAPMVFALAITSGEISILKGLRRLKRVAIISAAAAFVTLLCTLPFFYQWQIAGIIPALVVSTLAVMCVHLYFSLQVYAWYVEPFSARIFRQGMGMVKLGVPYVLAAIAGSLSALAIPACLVKLASLEVVGLYQVGYGLMVTYAGIVFVAVEADYFPRLSSVNHDVERLNKVINQQIEVCILLIAPFLIFFITCMPLVIRMLYTEEFLSVTNMAVCASFYMFFRALVVPIAYTALAKGDSVMYLLMEVIYDIVSVAMIGVGFYYGGLMGTGVALSLASLFDLLMIFSIYGRSYGFRFSPSALRLALLQGTCLSCGVILCLQPNVWIKYIGCSVVLLLSLVVSVVLLQKKTTLLGDFKNKIIRKFIRHE